MPGVSHGIVPKKGRKRERKSWRVHFPDMKRLRVECITYYEAGLSRLQFLEDGVIRISTHTCRGEAVCYGYTLHSAAREELRRRIAEEIARLNSALGICEEETALEETD